MRGREVVRVCDKQRLEVERSGGRPVAMTMLLHGQLNSWVTPACPCAAHALPQWVGFSDRLLKRAGTEVVKIRDEQRLEMERDGGRLVAMTMLSRPQLYIPGNTYLPMGDVRFHVEAADHAGVPGCKAGPRQSAPPLHNATQLCTLCRALTRATGTATARTVHASHAARVQTPARRALCLLLEQWLSRKACALGPSC